MSTIPESYVALTCRHCGHTADLFDFTATPITGELPSGTYQCPACRRAWRMEKTAPGRWTSSGFFIPPTMRAVAVPTML